MAELLTLYDGFELRVNKNESPIIVGAEVELDVDEGGVTTVEEAEQVLTELKQADFEPDGEFDTGNHTLRLVIKVRFNSQETSMLAGAPVLTNVRCAVRMVCFRLFATFCAAFFCMNVSVQIQLSNLMMSTKRTWEKRPCRLKNRVTDEVHITKDFRGHEWTFGRDLPKLLPAKEPLNSPWTIRSIA